MKNFTLQGKKDKRIGKILFWCLAPFIFASFMRLFVLVFYFIYGQVLIWSFGARYSSTVRAAAIITASGFAMATLLYLYRQYRIHILEER